MHITFRQGAMYTFFFFAFVSFFQVFYYQYWDLFFWQCYWGSLFIGLGILLQKRWLVASQLYLLFIPLIVWHIDFFSFFFMEGTLFGLTEYYFEQEFFSLARLVSLQHFLVIPLGIGVLWKERSPPKLIGIIFALAQLGVFFVLIRLFGSASENINCVFAPCIPLPFSYSYVLVWFAISYGLTFFSFWILERSVGLRTLHTKSK